MTFIPPNATNAYAMLILDGPTNHYYEIDYTLQLGTNAYWYYGDYIYTNITPYELYEPTYLGYLNAFFKAELVP